ncbi:hypothetical protein D3C71_1773590 [compost metagenome]
MGGQKLRQPFHGKEVKKIGRCGHPHQAAGLLVARCQVLARVHQAIDSAGAAVIKGLPRSGERQVAGGALHQPGAQLCFQVLHAAAEGVGWHAQAARCLGKAAIAHHLHKGGHVVEVQHGDIPYEIGRLQSDCAV